MTSSDGLGPEQTRGVLKANKRCEAAVHPSSQLGGTDYLQGKVLLHAICFERPEASTTNKPNKDQDGQGVGKEVEERDRDTRCNITGMRERTGNHLGKKKKSISTPVLVA